MDITLALGGGGFIGYAHIGSMDRVNVREIAALGEEAVEESLAALRKLRKKQKWRRWFNLKSS